MAELESREATQRPLTREQFQQQQDAQAALNSRDYETAAVLFGGLLSQAQEGTAIPPEAFTGYAEAAICFGNVGHLEAAIDAITRRCKAAGGKLETPVALAYAEALAMRGYEDTTRSDFHAALGWYQQAGELPLDSQRPGLAGTLERRAQGFLDANNTPANAREALRFGNQALVILRMKENAPPELLANGLRDVNQVRQTARERLVPPRQS